MNKLENLIKFNDFEEIDIDGVIFKTRAGRLYYYQSCTFQLIYIPLTALTEEQTSKIYLAIKELTKNHG
jgi:hypothetical protein